MAWAASHLQTLYDEVSNGMQGGSVYFARQMGSEGLIAHVKHLRDPRTGKLASQPFERRTSMGEIESLKAPVPARAKTRAGSSYQT